MLVDKWTTLLALLVAVMPLSLWQAREAQIYGDRKNARRWLVGGTVVAVTFGTAIVLVGSRYPGALEFKAASAFGPDWSCQMTPKAGQICFRYPLKP